MSQRCSLGRHSQKGDSYTSLLKLAAGVEIPDKGRIIVDGFDLWKDEVAARRKLAYLPEQADLTPYASVKDIVRLVCRLRGEPAESGMEALRFFSLQEVSARTVRELSLGQRRRAVFAAVLIGRPTHVLLDEPLEGMDRKISGNILAWIRRRVESGTSVVVVSHSLEPFLDLVSQAIIVKQGELCRISGAFRLIRGFPAFFLWFQLNLTSGGSLIYHPRRSGEAK